MARNDFEAADVDEVLLGDTNQAGEDNRNVARMAALLAGFPVEVPGATVNRLCASGLEAVSQAARAVRADEGDLILAGGVESMSRAPMVAAKPEQGFPRGGLELQDTTIGWRFVNPRMEDLYGTPSMGQTAENVAERYGVSRQDQDAFALESHRRAVASAEAGFFDGELVAVERERRGGRRGPAAGLVDGAAGRAARRLLRRGVRDRGQLVTDQRRCRVRGGGRRGARGAAGCRAAGADRGHGRRRRGARADGHRARPRHPAGAGACRAARWTTSTWWS